jgi:hypothetical protein
MNTSTPTSLLPTRRAIVRIASAVLIAAALGITLVFAFLTTTHAPARGLSILPSTLAPTAARAVPIDICVYPGGPGNVHVPHRQGIVGGLSVVPSTTSRTAVKAVPVGICVYPGGPGNVHVPHWLG